MFFTPIGYPPTAIHIESMFGYDTDIFMLALRRFASERGRPQKLYSDPRSQLVGVKREMKDAMSKSGSENGSLAHQMLLGCKELSSHWSRNHWT